MGEGSSGATKWICKNVKGIQDWMKAKRAKVLDMKAWNGDYVGGWNGYIAIRPEGKIEEETI